MDGLKPDIIRGINQLLHKQPICGTFKIAKEIFEQEDAPTNIKIVINETKGPRVSTPGGTIGLLVMRL